MRLGLGLFLMYAALLITGCQKDRFNTSGSIGNLPGEPQLILSTSDIKSSKAYLSQSFFFKPDFNSKTTIGTLLDSLPLTDIAIGLYPEEGFVLSGQSQNILDSLQPSATDLKIEDFRTIISSDSLFMVTREKGTLISNDSLLLYTAPNKNSNVFESLSKIDGNNQSFKLFLNNTAFSVPLSFNEVSADSEGNLLLHINDDGRSLNYSGVSVTDSIHLNLLTSPKASRLLEIIPAKASQWQLIHQSSKSDSLKTNISSNPVVFSRFIEEASEVATFTISNEELLLFHYENANSVLQQLTINDPLETYRDLFIYEISSEEVPSHTNPLIRYSKSVKYFCIAENFVLASHNINGLKESIASYVNGKSVSNSQKYQQLAEHLKTTFSYMSYGNSQALGELFVDKKLPYNSSFFQLSKAESFIHVNGTLNSYKAEQSNQPLINLASITLDAELLNAPQLVNNHVTKAKDIIVQDIENNLYLISNQGKIYWKKRLNGPILGKVQQIDMYKNGRLQLAFCTTNRLYVLDRNGNTVAPFPKNFKDPITQPLSVFDYDNNKNFRLLLTQGNELLMLSAKGKRIKGFKYKRDGIINSQPKHFRIGRKDYIVLKAEGRFKILNRRGLTRLNVKKTFKFSINDIYLYQSKFTTTSAGGELIQVDTKGRVNRQALQLPKDHQLRTTSKTLVTQTENKLNIKLKSIDLDYGIYTKPQIFYLNDKIYVSTTDLQSKKSYLFDSQAKAISGFPIFGTSAAIMGNIDTSRNLEVIIQSDTNALSIYQLQ